MNLLAANKFDKDRVIRAAEATIKWVLDARKKGVDKLLAPHMRYRKFWLCGPWIERTIEQAERWVDGWDLRFAEHAYEGTIVSASQIIRVTRNTTGAEVWLTTAEFNVIAANYEKETVCA